MALKNYQCSKCGTLVKKDGTPNTSGCPSGGSHSWKKLGDVGDIPYQCSKCGTLVNSKGTPESSGCPSGGSHSWKKL